MGRGYKSQKIRRATTKKTRFGSRFSLWGRSGIDFIHSFIFTPGSELVVRLG
jgi:hypothetical protein